VTFRGVTTATCCVPHLTWKAPTDKVDLKVQLCVIAHLGLPPSKPT
jgi:hypothetical protein